MKKELFIPYKETLMGWIKSCVNNNQLLICNDVIDRFYEQFVHCIPYDERVAALDELRTEYLQQQAMMNV